MMARSQGHLRRWLGDCLRSSSVEVIPARSDSFVAGAFGAASRFDSQDDGLLGDVALFEALPPDGSLASTAVLRLQGAVLVGVPLAAQVWVKCQHVGDAEFERLA